MGTEVLMVRLKLANVCLPAEIVLIYVRNGLIKFLRGHVREVSIDSFGMRRAVSVETADQHLYTRLYCIKCFRTNLNITLFLNDGISIREVSDVRLGVGASDLHRLLDVVAFHLYPVEALHAMLLHC